MGATTTTHERPGAPRDDERWSDPSKTFRKLAYLSVALTFALVIVGGVVRISDSGLGCGAAGSGTHGWPLCSGRVIPLVDANMIVEYSHRILAGSLAILIAVMAFVARRRFPERRALRRATVAAFALVLFQAALGGLSVEKGLEEELVAAHLGVAMLQIGILILIATLSRGESRSGPERARGGSTGRAVRIVSVAASAAVLATIVAGGYMSASELHGTGKQEVSVHTACGTDFPSCNGSFLPFGTSRALDIHLTHRAFMYLASALVVALFLMVLMQGRGRRSPRSSPDTLGAAAAIMAILLVQVTLGALNVWLGEHAWLVVVHLAVGTLLWCSLVYFSLLALGARRAVAAKARGAKEATVEAVPA